MDNFCITYLLIFLFPALLNSLIQEMDIPIFLIVIVYFQFYLYDKST